MRVLSQGPKTKTTHSVLAYVGSKLHPPTSTCSAARTSTRFIHSAMRKSSVPGMSSRTTTQGLTLVHFRLDVSAVCWTGVRFRGCLREVKWGIWGCLGCTLRLKRLRLS